MYFIHESHGRLAEQFRKYYAYAVKALSNPPTRTSDASSEVLMHIRHARLVFFYKIHLTFFSGTTSVLLLPCI